MNFVVLADPADDTALKTALLLRQRHGPERVQIRTADELLLAHWEHRVSNAGVHNVVRFHDGAQITNSERTIIFNRLTAFAPPIFAGASAVNREYARTEMYALFLSWLESDRHRVVNPPSPTGSVSGVMRPLIWQHLALRSGFRTLGLGATTSTRRFPAAAGSLPRPDVSSVADPYQNASMNSFGWYSRPLPDRTISALVIGDKVLGDVSGITSSSCVRLTTLARIDLLGIDLAFEAPTHEGPEDPGTFIGANPCPVIADPSAIHELVQYLETLASIDCEAISI